MNKDVLKKYENEKYCLEIIRDEDSENPRTWDNIWTLSMDNYMDCYFGDIKQDKSRYGKYNALEKLANHLGIDLEKEIYDEENEEYYDEYKEQEELLEEIEVLGLLKGLRIRGYYYHEISISNFLEEVEGYAFVSFETIKKEYGEVNDENIEKTLSYLKGEIEVYNQWLDNNVYGYMLYKKEKCECCNNIEYKNLDSCWGFYGDNFEENELFENIDLPKEELDELIQDKNEEVA